MTCSELYMDVNYASKKTAEKNDLFTKKTSLSSTFDRSSSSLAVVNNCAVLNLVNRLLGCPGSLVGKIVLEHWEKTVSK